MKSKDSCPVWGEGVGKVPDGNSPKLYSTSRTVLGARGVRLPRATRQVCLLIRGKKHWLWRAVDQDGVVLDVLVQSRRDKRAAKRLLRKLLKRQMRAPRILI